MDLTPQTLAIIKDFENVIIPELRRITAKLKDYYFDPGRLKIEVKTEFASSGDIDFVTNMDKQIETELYDLIHKRFPEFGFSVEEDKKLNDDSRDFNCAMDAIDGTKYFMRGVPLFSSQIGLTYKQQPVLGLVYNPLTDQMYFGSELTPTNVNGRELKVSQVEHLADAFVISGVSTHRINWEKDQDWIAAKLTQLVLKCQRVRAFGSGGLSGAWVAAGGLDALVFLQGDAPQEIIPSQALIQYAGGVTDLVEIPSVTGLRFIAGNAKLVAELKEFLLS